jgi:uncharacterized SAM-binding protein YcdF (DUF218 family)
MEYLLSKLLPLFVYPLGVSILLILVTLRLAWIGRRGGALVTGLSAAGILWVAAMPATASALLMSLQGRYPPVTVEDVPAADAIVVLGGIGQLEKGDPPVLELSDSIDRLRHAAKLFAAGKGNLVIVSGGATEGDLPEADVMAMLLEEWGVPSAAILRETKSRNTRQNALQVRSILRAQGIVRVLLVTSGFHMRRAEAVFHKVGVEVIPAATDYYLGQSVSPLLDYLPDADALVKTTAAMKEYMGMVVYRWRGWVE